MGEFVDMVEGHSNEAIGKAKRAIGDATNRSDIRAEGDAQEAVGDLQKPKGEIKGALGDKI